MNLRYLLAFVLMMICLPAFAVYRYVGGDISLLPEYEQAGAQYKDHDGTPIAELLPFLHEEGMNAMRVRLFVNPSDYKGVGADKNACQDLDYILPLCKRIKGAGFALMLDFHYSDTWADPAKQWTPKAWEGLTDEQLYQKIYDYTKDCLAKLNEAEATPDFIQPGNEISYGMLWGPVGAADKDLKKTFMGNSANWDRLGQLLNQAIKACREECPKAKIVIHTERVAQPDVQKNFYDKLNTMGVDYDIIGLSYYPYFHGKLPVLNRALSQLTTDYPTKEIMIVETGYAYKWEVPGTNQKVDYEYSDAGQDKFAKELVETLRAYEQVTGFFWWWMEYNAYGTSLSGWYNAPLFDSLTGKACSAMKTICSFAEGNDGISSIGIDQEQPVLWYDLKGRVVADPSLPGLYISRHCKLIIR